MPIPYQLSLIQEQEAELARTRDHARQPYLRERAAVLLKIAAGLSIRRAARTGGLKPHHRDTVCDWVARYQTEGLAGLLVRKGRGRKPASFPRSGSAGSGGGPDNLGKAACPVWPAAHALVARVGSVKSFASLRESCLTTVWRTLHRWKLAYKRGRRQVHSPDWEYETKVQRIETITWYSRQAPGQIVRLYEDELTRLASPHAGPRLCSLRQ